MRQVLNGNNVDTTVLVLAWLRSNQPLAMATLYLIGEPDDPQALKLTDWEGPLHYGAWGTFQAATIKRGSVPTKIGLEVAQLGIEWSPPVTAETETLETANPYQKALIGIYDNWPVRLWTAYMPTPGDADTYGCSELFGGRIGASSIERGRITFNCNSFLDVINLNVPAQVIEITNPLASGLGATPPEGMDSVPQFNVIIGSTAAELAVDCTSPDPHHIFAQDELHNGFLVFNDRPGATLAKRWSAIQSNRMTTISGSDYNLVLLYTPLPWPPTPGSDTLYISGKAPTDSWEGRYIGFPYLPKPEGAL